MTTTVASAPAGVGSGQIAPQQTSTSAITSPQSPGVSSSSVTVVPTTTTTTTTSSSPSPSITTTSSPSTTTPSPSTTTSSPSSSTTSKVPIPQYYTENFTIVLQNHQEIVNSIDNWFNTVIKGNKTMFDKFNPKGSDSLSSLKNYFGVLYKKIRVLEGHIRLYENSNNIAQERISDLYKSVTEQITSISELESPILNYDFGKILRDYKNQKSEKRKGVATLNLSYQNAGVQLDVLALNDILSSHNKDNPKYILCTHIDRSIRHLANTIETFVIKNIIDPGLEFVYSKSIDTNLKKLQDSINIFYSGITMEISVIDLALLVKYYKKCQIQ